MLKTVGCKMKSTVVDCLNEINTYVDEWTIRSQQEIPTRETAAITSSHCSFRDHFGSLTSNETGIHYGAIRKLNTHLLQ